MAWKSCRETRGFRVPQSLATKLPPITLHPEPPLSSSSRLATKPVTYGDSQKPGLVEGSHLHWVLPRTHIKAMWSTYTLHSLMDPRCSISVPRWHCIIRLHPREAVCETIKEHACCRTVWHVQICALRQSSLGFSFLLFRMGVTFHPETIL